MDKIRIDRDNNRAFILDSEVKLEGCSGWGDEIKCDLKETRGLLCSDVYERLELFIYDTEEIAIPFFNRIWVTGEESEHEALLTIYITAPEYSWYGDISLSAVVRELRALVADQSTENGYEIGSDEDTFWVSIYFPLEDESLYSKIREFLVDMRSKLISVEERIRGFQWRPEYDKDEGLFTTELLIPLFGKMGYNHVRYNHGPREFGKDILLSETTKLYNTRNISVQVKAGNVSGKASTLIDTLISQIKDSFDVPVEGPGLTKQFRISEVYVVISGSYSENAKDKINAKLPSSLSASVYFLDKEDIEWLTQKNWPLK